MKHLIFTFLTCISIAAYSQATLPAIGSAGAITPDKGITNYKLTFKVRGLKNTECYLGFDMGDKKYVRDTAKVDANGICTFSGTDTLVGGIYLFVLPTKNFFEFIISGDEKEFTIECDTVDYYKNMVITGSKENTLWRNYLNYTTANNTEAEAVRDQKKAIDSTLSADEKKRLEEKYDKQLEGINKTLNDYRLDIIAKEKGTFVSAILNSLRSPEIPDAPKGMTDAEKKTYEYWYFRTHYWDYIDITDGRMVRTPIFEGKLKYYFESVLPQIADSMMLELESFINKTRGSLEMRRFVTQTLVFQIANSQVMCMDRAFVWMVDKYYIGGDGLPWLDESTKKKLLERADKLRPLLCGERIPNLILPDTSGTVWHNLHQMPNDYVVVYFWESTCGHCKKATPELQTLYDDYLKVNGIGLYTIEGNLETETWKKFLIDNKITFLSVSDNPEINKNAQVYIQSGKTTYESLNFRQTFDLSSFPVIYILDKDRKIIAKKLGVEQLKEFFENYFKSKLEKNQHEE